MSSTMAPYLHFIPPAIFATLPTTFVISYFWSMEDGHVNSTIPNIGLIGAQPPESCFFGMMLNLVAFMMVFTIYVRHNEVIEVIRAKRISETVSHAVLINKTATITGFVACGSLDVTANFQDAPGVAYVHQLAAALGVCSLSLYMVQQAVITSWMVPDVNRSWIAYARWILGILAVIVVLSSGIFNLISFYILKTGHLAASSQVATTLWAPDIPGYDWNCLSAGTEWAMAAIICAFFLTFYWDFKQITILAPEVEIRSEPIPEPVAPKFIHFFE